MHMIHSGGFGETRWVEEGRVGMWRVLTPSAMLAVIGPPIVATVTAWFLSLLPREVFDFAIIWVIASLGPAVLFGHCALSSEH